MCPTAPPEGLAAQRTSRRDRQGERRRRRRTWPSGLQCLDAAQRTSRLDADLEKFRRVPVLICEEVGYIPSEPEAAAQFYALVASRYERASMIVSSNKPFSAWGEIFGDAVAVAAIVDRLVHHAEIINLKGVSYPLKNRMKEVEPSFQPARTAQRSTGVDNGTR